MTAPAQRRRNAAFAALALAAGGAWALAGGVFPPAGTTRAGEPEDRIFADGFERRAGTIDIASLTPPDGMTLAETAVPDIGARYTGFTASPAAVLTIDGIDVTTHAQVGIDAIRYVPPGPLAEGPHTVDLAIGNNGVRWSFTTATPPTIDARIPADAILPSGVRSVVSATFADAGAGVDAASVRVTIDGADVTAQAGASATGFHYVPASAWTDGRHVVRVEVADRAGQRQTAEWTFAVTLPPVISAIAPIDTTLPYDSRPTLTARFTDAAQTIDQASISLALDDEQATPEIVMANPRDGTLRYTPPAPLEPGTHRVLLTVKNALGEDATVLWQFEVAHVETLAITSPAAGATVLEPAATVVARVRSSRGYADAVTINGVLAAVEARNAVDADYTAAVTLVPGANAIAAVARFEDGRTLTQSVDVIYDAPPVVTVTSPHDWQILGPVTGDAPVQPGGARDLTGSVERPVAVTGTTARPVASVDINQQAARLGPDGMTFTFDRFLLHEGTNMLSVNATDTHGRVGSTQLIVYVDQTAPILTIEGPQPDAVTSQRTIDVRGIVNDAVEGGINAPEPQVVVHNRTNAQSITASTLDRYYLGRDVPLEIGANRLEVIATDAQGNARPMERRVTRVAAGSSRITPLAGDRQSGGIGNELPQPVVVVAIGPDGLPLARRPVRFDVLRGSGSIATAQGTPTKPDGVQPARNLVVATDDGGRAQVWLTLGSEAADAGNMVRAWHEDIAEDALFTATGLRRVPYYVLVSGAAGSQYVPTNSQPVEPLTAIVLDDERNPMAGAAVQFVIDQGDARFNDRSAAGSTVGADGRSLVVAADKNGQASVRPLAGGTPGTVRVTAHVKQGASLVGSAVFQLVVLERGDGPTRFSGVVLDHTGAALSGVRLSISRTGLSATSDDEGRFRFDEQVPAGKIDLYVDGRAVQKMRNGTMLEYPALHFETAVVQGGDNQLPHPIYLPPVDRAQAKIVGGDADVSLTLPGIEGFEMIVKANSVTFPDGSRVGPLVVTPVHVDRLPMVPPGPGGAFSGVAWTIQPTNARFDPPITVKIPNTEGLRPGETRPVVQWDHDLATFVPMGRGTVSEDGTQIVTDAGSGITKAGWGGTPSPPPPQTCATNPPPQTCRDGNCKPCPDCFDPQGGSCPVVCFANVDIEGPKCGNNACMRCNGGQCKEKFAQKPSKPIVVKVTEEAAVVVPWPGGCDPSTSRGCTMVDPRDGGVILDLEVEPYCEGSGQWRFRLMKIRHRFAISANPLGSGAALLTDAVINQYSQCADLQYLRESVITLALRYDPTPGNFYAGFDYGRPESSLGHEQVHVKRIYALINRDSFKIFELAQRIEEVRVSMATYPTKEAALASPELREELSLRRDEYFDSVARPANRIEYGHPEPRSAYDNGARAGLTPWLNKIKARRTQLHCQ